MATPEEAFRIAQQRMLERYGVEARSQFLEVPSTGGRAHVLVAGDGPAVVMLSGIGTPGAMWAPLMAALDGFRLIAVDLPAYGLTDTTADFADDLRRNAVRFLDEVLDGLALDAPLFVSNSLGSLWASWLALDRPARVTAMVQIGCTALVLDTSAPFPMRLLSVRGLGRLMTRLQPPSAKQVEALSRMVNEYPLPPELADLLLATERVPDFRRTFLATLHAALRLRGSRPETRLTAAQLGRIRHPTLVIWGRNDPFGSVDAGRRMVQAMPDADLHVVDGGHAPWVSGAEHFGPLVANFLHRFDRAA